jgi:predicted PurR-regulated permease PerM
MANPTLIGANPRPLALTAALMLSIAAVAWAKVVVIPMALAILLAFILKPLVSLLQARGLRRTQAVLLVLLLSLLLVGGILTLVSIQLHELASELPSHKGNMLRKLRDLLGGGSGVLENWSQMIDDLSADLQGAQAEAPVGSPPVTPVTIQPDRRPSLAFLPEVAQTAIMGLAMAGFVVALTASILLLREDLRNRLIRLIGASHVTSTTRAFDEATKRISSYLVIQLVMNTAFAVLFGLGLALLGVPYAFLWSVLAVLLRFIPYVGTWLAAALPLLVSLATGDWIQTLLVLAFVLALGLVTNYVFEPLAVSRRVGVSAVALVVSAAFWTWLWGPIGLILSTPITVCLSVLGKHVEPLSFLDVLLGTRPPLEPELGYYQRLLAHDIGEAAELAEKYVEEHGLGELCDQVLVPTLVHAGVDQAQGQLPAEEVAYIVEATEEVLEGIEESDASPAEPATTVPLVICCPVHDGREELALKLFARLLGPERGRTVILSSKTMAAEVLERVKEEEPALVCIATLSPHSLAMARYLCKRLRARFPRLPVLAGCWGRCADWEEAEKSLQKAGATQVATSLQETLGQVSPVLSLATHLEPTAARS